MACSNNPFPLWGISQIIEHPSLNGSKIPVSRMQGTKQHKWELNWQVLCPTGSTNN